MILGISRVFAGGGGGGGSDPHFSNVVLLMGFEDTNGSTGAPGMNDESVSAHGTASGGGSGCKISTSQYKFGSSSLFNNGAGWSLQYSDSTDFHFGAGNFTVECFIYPTTVSGTQFIVGQWIGSPFQAWQLWLNGSTLSWNTSTSGSDNNADIAGSTAVTINAWHHIAIDYDGSKYRLYLDGVMIGSFSTPRTLASPSVDLGITANSNGTAFIFSGYLDELRITKAVARYASDSGLTVPTAAFPRS